MRTGRMTALSLTLLAATLGGREASAQNTYADVPFNQGSLFYRPSGARPPQQATTTTTTTVASAPSQPRRFRWFARRPATVTQPRYYYPTTARQVVARAPVQTVPGTYYAAPVAVPAR